MSQSVIACPLPPESRLQDRIRAGDFLDCYRIEADMPARKAAEIITDFPVWADALVLLRKFVTAPFGLKQSGPEDLDRVGPFPIESETVSELIAGFDDKHLDFRVSVFSREGQVHLATWVHRHNLGGRLYLALIMPFHILIARDALTRVARKSGAGKPGGGLVKAG